MKKKLLFLIPGLAFFLIHKSSAQITILGSFNPAGISTLCGIGYDPDSARVWVYGCNDSQFHCFDSTGVLLNSFPVPGGTANDVDIEIAPEQLMIHQTTVPKGQVLFINGENGVAEVYALNNNTGVPIDTLIPDFGTDHVVGGAYHHERNTFYMLQDNVPGTALENMVAEINSLTGDTLNTFQITNYMSVFFGDIEVGDNGNLFIVSSAEDSVAEFTTAGVFVQKYDLPQGVSNLSGIALDCAAGEAWVSSNSGTVFHLGNFPCGPTGINEISGSHIYLSEVSPNPFGSEINFSVLMKQNGTLKISVVNIFGEQIKNIYDGHAAAGKKNFTITNQSLGKGIYFLKAEGEHFSECRKILCIQ